MSELRALFPKLTPFQSVRIYPNPRVFLSVFHKPWEEIHCVIGGELEMRQEASFEKMLARNNVSVVNESKRDNYDTIVLRLPCDLNTAFGGLMEIVSVFAIDGQPMLVQAVDGIVGGFDPNLMFE